MRFKSVSKVQLSFGWYNWELHYQNYSNQGAGHLIDLPFCPPSSLTKHPLFPKETLLQCGGDDIIKHGQAQEKIWKELLIFFKHNLMP